MSDETARWQAWEAWVERAIPVDAGRRPIAIDAVKRALGDGLSPHAAAAAARLSVGTPLLPSELASLIEELQITERLVSELGTLQPDEDLTEKAIARLNAIYRTRLESLRDLSQAVQGRPAGVAPLQPSPRPAGPSLREFFADNSILVISIAGAFLLIVATLLFEIYGTTAFGGEGRFGAVLVLNLVFGTAGYLSLGRPSLQLVGQTYTAIFALMVPLTIAAAWVFLALESRGISRELAAGLGGLACAVLYGFLATRLGSKAYAVLSLLALAVGWIGLVAATHRGIWAAPWISALVFAYIAIAYVPARSPKPIALFTRFGEPFIHGAALLAIGWSFGQAVSEWTNLSLGAAGRPSLQLPASLGLVTAAYGFYVWRSRRIGMLWTVWTGASLTVLALTEPLAIGQRGYAVELVVLAWVYAASARWTTHAGLRFFLRAGAAVQSAVPVFLSANPDGLQAALLLTGTGVPVFMAINTRRPAWLLLAAAIFTAGWYWLAKSLLPPPSRPTADTLVLTYSPLPAVYGVLGLGLALASRRNWALPLYAAGAVLAVAVTVGAAGQNDLTLAGRALLFYAGLAYVASALETWWPGIVASLLAAAAALLILLTAASVAPRWFPLAMTGTALVFYAAHAAWGDPLLARSHRYAALAIVGLTAAFSFTVPDFSQKASPGSVSALIALLATAGLTYVDGRLYTRPLLEYAAAVIASLGCIWIARYVGIDNLQAYALLPGIVLIAAGVGAQLDERRPADPALCRVAIVAGLVVMIGATASQSLTETVGSFYTVFWVVEAVAVLLAGIGLRSRTLVIAGGAALALGALRALVIVLESVQVYIVFGVIAILLLLVAGLLAATRDRVAEARTAIRESWQDWT